MNNQRQTKKHSHQQGIAKSGAEQLRWRICTRFNSSNSIELFCLKSPPSAIPKPLATSNMTTRILILLTSSLLSLFSCQDKGPVKQSQIDTITATTSIKAQATTKEIDEIPSWQTVNDELERKYQSRIEFSDIEKVFRLLLKEQLIDSNELIDESFYPTFTHLSPTVMLKDVRVDSRYSNRPLAMRVFTGEDIEFILSQERLRTTTDFKWSTITDKISKGDSYPKIEIGIPVFSLDKNKFIVGIHKYKSENCLTIVSYLFITTGKRTKYYLFENVTCC